MVLKYERGLFSRIFFNFLGHPVEICTLFKALQKVVSNNKRSSLCRYLHYICQSLFKLKFCANFLPPVREKTCPAKLRLSPFAAVWPILTFVQCSLSPQVHICAAPDVTFVQRTRQRNSHICHQNGFDIVPRGGSVGFVHCRGGS